jgi:hypothetical protein
LLQNRAVPYILGQAAVEGVVFQGCGPPDETLSDKERDKGERGEKQTLGLPGRQAAQLDEDAGNAGPDTHPEAKGPRDEKFKDKKKDTGQVPVPPSQGDVKFRCHFPPV